MEPGGATRDEMNPRALLASKGPSMRCDGTRLENSNGSWKRGSSSTSVRREASASLQVGCIVPQTPRWTKKLALELFIEHFAASTGPGL